MKNKKKFVVPKIDTENTSKYSGEKLPDPVKNQFVNLKKMLTKARK